MLLVKNISAGVAPYFLDGRDPGTWTPAANRLLDLSGPVTGTALRRVLDGRHPDSGQRLQPRRRRRRQPGWDLIFTAPKSVSLLAATTGERESVWDAHVAAVDDILEHLERGLTIRSAAGPGGVAPAGGLIGARFEHRTNSASEPHAHSHVLVANLTCTARGWSAVCASDWYVGRQSLGALYQMALRHHLRHRGWNLEWRMRPDGLADLAGVPTAAVRAASSQSRMAAALGRFEARQEAAPRSWHEHATRAGYDPAALRAEARLALEAGEGVPKGEALAARVTTRLAVRRSDFRQADAVVALSASLPEGCRPGPAMEWVERFCANSQPVPSPTSGRRWTTALGRQADDRLVAALDELCTSSPEHRRGAGGTMVTVLASPPGRTALIDHAEHLERMRAEWSQTGARVAVAAPDRLTATRWEVLTGLSQHRPGTRVDVLVVDQADRRPSAELLSLVEAARAGSTHLIFVEGGTLPRLGNPASHGLAGFSARLGRTASPPAPAWTPETGREPGRWGRRAAGEVLARWTAGDREELLVGLGLEEVLSLNRAVRAIESGAGRGEPRAAGFRPGDRVVVLRAGAGRPSYGTFGRVAADHDDGRVSIRWDGVREPSTYDRGALAGVGHGWAATPHLAQRAGRPVLLLGPLEAAPRLRALARASIERNAAEASRGLGLER